MSILPSSIDCLPSFSFPNITSHRASLSTIRIWAMGLTMVKVPMVMKCFRCLAFVPMKRYVYSSNTTMSSVRGIFSSIEIVHNAVEKNTAMWPRKSVASRYALIVLLGTISVVAHGEVRLTLVSQNAAGEQGNNISGNPSISADGTVAFESFANNLVSGDTNGELGIDIFVKNLDSGEVERINEGPGGEELGVQANNLSIHSSMSADGRYVAFSSGASNLVSGANINGNSHVFVADVDGVYIPSTPGNIRATVYSREAAEVFWDRSIDNGSVLYEVFRNGVSMGVVDALGVFEDQLQPGTLYSYQVSAIDNDGNRSAYAVVNFTTNEIDPPVASRPETPSNLRFIVYSRTAAELFWDRPTDPSYLYRVYFNNELRAITGGGSWWFEFAEPGSTN